MLKDLAEAMYYRTLTKSMDEAEPEQVLNMFERYGDGRRYYDRYRYANGRFAPKEEVRAADMKNLHTGT